MAKAVKTVTDDQVEEITKLILLIEGHARNEYVLGILSEFVGMVFDEQRTKAGQHAELCGALDAQVESVRGRVLDTPEDQRTLVDAGELVALQFVKEAVSKAFGFSTYSGPQRRAYILKEIKKELETVTAKLDPVRHILEDFQP